MKNCLTLLGAVAAVSVASSASATTYLPGSPQFQVTPCCGKTVFTAPQISGTIAITTTTAGTFTDDFQFTIPQNGVGSGALITSANSISSKNFLNFISVTFNGVTVPGLYNNMALVQFAGTSNVPITAFQVNNLVVTYKTNGSGTFGGNLTFDATSPVPEPITWATFLVGFGFIGAAVRRKGLEKLPVA